MKWSVHWLITTTDRLEIIVAALLLTLWLMSIHYLYIDYWLIYIFHETSISSLSVRSSSFLAQIWTRLSIGGLSSPQTELEFHHRRQTKNQNPAERTLQTSPALMVSHRRGALSEKQNVLMFRRTGSLKNTWKLTAVTESSQILKRSEHKKQTHQDIWKTQSATTFMRSSVTLHHGSLRS